MDLEAYVVSSALQQHRKDSDLENRRCQATRISFGTAGLTNSDGCSQFPISSREQEYSVSYRHMVTLRFTVRVRCRSEIEKRKRETLQKNHPTSRLSPVGEFFNSHGISRHLSEDNNNSPGPRWVFRKLVRASNIFQRDSLAKLEARPPRLKSSI
jgi:hypothetical protein